MFPESLDFSSAEIELDEDDYMLYNETSYLYDFKKGDFIYKDGNPVLVRGKKAMEIWIEKVLRTRMETYDIYDNEDDEGFSTGREYGSNIWQILRGAKLPRLVVQAETKRDIEETLSYNDKIRRIENYKITQGTPQNSHLLIISFDVLLVNGESVAMEVNI